MSNSQAVQGLREAGLQHAEKLLPPVKAERTRPLVILELAGRPMTEQGCRRDEDSAAARQSSAGTE